MKCIPVENLFFVVEPKSVWWCQIYSWADSNVESTCLLRSGGEIGSRQCPVASVSHPPFSLLPDDADDDDDDDDEIGSRQCPVASSVSSSSFSLLNLPQLEYSKSSPFVLLWYCITYYRWALFVVSYYGEKNLKQFVQLHSEACVNNIWGMSSWAAEKLRSWAAEQLSSSEAEKLSSWEAENLRRWEAEQLRS